MNNRFIKNIFWAIGGSLSTIVINFLSIMVLSRLLSPYEFGQLAIIMFFVNACAILISGGLGAALIQLEDIQQDDYNSVFTLNLLTSLALFILLNFAAPFIGKHYDDSLLPYLIHGTSIVLIFNCFHILGFTKLIIDLKFKTKAIIQSVSLFIAALFATIAAFLNYGTWSLVLMQVINSFCVLILLTIFSPVKYRLGLNRISIKRVLPFGANTTISAVIVTVYDEIYSIIIGRLFGLSEVGLYYQGKRIQLIIVNLFNSLAQGVVYSTLVKSKSDTNLFKFKYDSIINGFNYVIGLLIIIFFVNANFIVELVLGDQWMNSVVYVRLLLFASFWLVQEFFNRVIFKSYDRTGVILRLEIVKKIMQTISILVGIYFKDVYILLIGLIFSYFISSLLTNYYSHLILRTSARKIFNSIMGVFLISSLVSSLITYFFRNYDMFIQIAVTILGLVLYTILLHFFKLINVGNLVKNLKSLQSKN